jgi:hypothetical protein
MQFGNSSIRGDIVLAARELEIITDPSMPAAFSLHSRRDTSATASKIVSRKIMQSGTTLNSLQT